MPRSGIRQVMEVASAFDDVQHLEIGDPAFATPEHIASAAADAIALGQTRYTAARGEPALRELMQSKLRGFNGIESHVDDIVATTGGVAAIHLAMLATLEPGDVVLLPDPAWPNAEMIAVLIGARVVRYPLRRQDGYVPDPAVVRSIAADVGAKVIYVNSPGNPTGAVYPREILEALGEIAHEHDLWLISDECYEYITFEGEHFSLARAVPERTYSAFTFSKTYAMTGWRLGYLVTPPGYGDLVAKAQEATVSCASSVSQHAGIAALAGPQDAIARMVGLYRTRRDAAVAELDSAGFLASRPTGAFYVLADITRTGQRSIELATRLVRDYRVAVAPGATFGPFADDVIRVSLASTDEAIRVGLPRVVDALRAYSASASSVSRS